MIDAPAKYCHRLLAPRIGYLIGSYGDTGADLAPISNVTQVSSDPQIFVVAVYRKWQTFSNIVSTNRFSLSVPRVEHAEIVWRLGHRFSGYVFPDGQNKLAASGGEFDYDATSHGPILKAATGWCECEVIRMVDLDESDHGIFLSRVIRGGFNPDFLNPNGTYIRNSKPLMQVVLNTFATTSEHWPLEWLGPDHP